MASKSHLGNVPYVLIVIPALDLSGPSKGAVALLNGLLASGVNAEIFPMRSSETRVKYSNLLLVEEKSFFRKVLKLRRYLKASKFKNKPPVLISFCLQADMLALMAGERSRIISSVRGNLYKNYADDFGLMGKFLAYLHYQLLRCFPVITALNTQMHLDLLKYSKNVELIPNFIDEINLSTDYLHPSGHFKYIFIGTLSRRKGIIELIHAFMECIERYPDTKLYILGDGPLKKNVEDLISTYQAFESIKVLGFVSDPITILKQCDVFVLPSYSEGISRAAMEALYFGKRCIMQNVDGNAELILNNEQGKLISNISYLSAELIRFRRLGREPDINRLPLKFRQKTCVSNYIFVLRKYFNYES